MIIPELFSQVNMLFTGAGVPLGAEMTFGVDNPTVASPNTVATAIETAWLSGTPDMTGCYSVDVSCTGILVKNGPNDTGASGVRSVSMPGTLGSSGGPAQSILVSKTTSFGGRKGRGRFYFPGVAEADVASSGIITAARVTSITNLCNTFLSLIAAAGFQMVVLHQDDITPPRIVDTLTCSNQVATQRRRNRR